MAEKYQTSIVLAETGEDLREDTLLRFDSVLKKLCAYIEPSNRRFVLNLLADDIDKLRGRIQGK